MMVKVNNKEEFKKVIYDFLEINGAETKFKLNVKIKPLTMAKITNEVIKDVEMQLSLKFERPCFILENTTLLCVYFDGKDDLDEFNIKARNMNDGSINPYPSWMSVSKR